MNALPAELLVNVFSHLHFHDHLAATHVCRSWREISYGHPAILWSRPRIGDAESGTRLLPDFLALSQYSNTGQLIPLDLHITMNYDHSFRAIAAIAENMDRIRSLTIRSPRHSPLLYDAAVKIRVEVLFRPAPLLEHLELDFTNITYGGGVAHQEDVFERLREFGWRQGDLLRGIIWNESDDSAAFKLEPWMMVPVGLFADQAPCLRSLTLVGGFTFTHDYPALANLRVLRIELGNAGVVDRTRENTVLERSVHSIVRHLPALEHLDLTIPPEGFKRIGIFVRYKPMERALKEVQISMWQDPTPLLRYFSSDRVRILSTPMYADWMNDSAWKSRGSPTTLQITSRLKNPMDYDWRFAADDGRISTLYFDPLKFRDTTSRALSYLAQNLTILSVPASQLEQFNELRFTRLQRLRIVSEIGAQWTIGGLLRIDQGFRFECPALVELEMVSNDMWITTRDVVDFLNCYIRGRKNHLRRVDVWSASGGYGLDATADKREAREGTTVVMWHNRVPGDIVPPRLFASDAGTYTYDSDDNE